MATTVEGIRAELLPPEQSGQLIAKVDEYIGTPMQSYLPDALLPKTLGEHLRDPNYIFVIARNSGDSETGGIVGVTSAKILESEAADVDVLPTPLGGSFTTPIFVRDILLVEIMRELDKKNVGPLHVDIWAESPYVMLFEKHGFERTSYPDKRGIFTLVAYSGALARAIEQD